MDRSERRHRTLVKQKKRLGYKINKWRKNPRHIGQLKDGHMGCGCSLCKGHKHGFEPANKPSERRKLQDDGEDHF